jgi:hypothetical protein
VTNALTVDMLAFPNATRCQCTTLLVVWSRAPDNIPAVDILVPKDVTRTVGTAWNWYLMSYLLVDMSRTGCFVGRAVIWRVSNASSKSTSPLVGAIIFSEWHVVKIRRTSSAPKSAEIFFLAATHARRLAVSAEPRQVMRRT